MCSRKARARERYRYDLRRAEFAEDPAPLVAGCPCEACQNHSRAYLHYLSRAEELTALRLLTLHNLVYLERLVRGAREAIAGQRFAGYREALLNGRAPWEAAPRAASGP